MTETPNRFQNWLDEHAHDRPQWLLDKVRERGSRPFRETLFKGNGFARDDNPARR